MGEMWRQFKTCMTQKTLELVIFTICGQEAVVLLALLLVFLPTLLPDLPPLLMGSSILWFSE
jgi:hypothetical protein